MLLFLFISLALLGVARAETEVTEVTPTLVETGAGMPITIYGKDFADGFNVMENEVRLATTVLEVECQISNDRTMSSKARIVCNPQQGFWVGE